MRFFTILMLLWLCPLWAAASGQLSDLRLAELTDGTQLVFDLDTAVEYQTLLLDDPPRFVVDLNNTQLAQLIPSSAMRSMDVRGLRTGIHDGDDLRVVVDLVKQAHSQAYLVDHPSGTGKRLVIDIFRDREPIVGQHLPEVHRVAQVHHTSQGAAPFVIAIDPGHGGKDPGAIGSQGTQEKKVVMQIARQLKALVDQEPEMRAVLTRDKDVYLHLYERIDIAREQRADLFVSLHADAFTNREAHGSSVFILSTKGASSAAARWLAEQENEADRVGGGPLKVKDESLKPVVFDIYHDAVLAESMRLAEHMLGHLEKVGDVHRGHVERAGFAVLKAPDIPSVLVETAFISNPKEEEKLRSEVYQKKVAQAIMAGIRSYFETRPPRYMIVDAAPPPAAEETVEPSNFIPPPAAEAVEPEASDLVLVAQSQFKNTTPALSVPDVAQTQQVHPPADVILVSRPLVDPPPEQPLQQVHVVQRGESLADIARRYEMSVSQLQVTNGLSTNQLRLPAGSFLRILLSDS